MIISVPGTGYLLQNTGQGSPRCSQNSMVFCHFSWLPTITNGNTLLLKTQHILVVGHKEIDLEFNGKLHAECLALIVLEDAMQTSGDKRHQ